MAGGRHRGRVRGAPQAFEPDHEKRRGIDEGERAVDVAVRTHRVRLTQPPLVRGRDARFREQQADDDREHERDDVHATSPA